MGRILNLATKTEGGGNPIVVLQERIVEPKAAVDSIMARIDVIFANATAGLLPVLSENFCHNTTVRFKRWDGKSFLRSVPLRMMEWFNQAVRIGRLVDLLDNVDTADVPIGGTLAKSYYVELPFKAPYLQRPEDGQVSLAHLGAFEIVFGSTGNAVTVQSAKLVLMADIADKKYENKGLRQMVSMHNTTATTKDSLPLGTRLAHLFAYTRVNATSPLTNSIGAQIRVDEQADLVRMDIADNVTLLANFRQYPGSGLPVARAASQTKCAILYGAPWGGPVADLPKGGRLAFEYASMAGTLGHQAYITHTLHEDSPEDVRRLSVNGDRADHFDRAVTEGNKPGVISSELAKVLPVKIRLPQAE